MNHAELSKRRGTNFLTKEEEAQAWARHDYDTIITAHMHLARRIAEEMARAWKMDADELTSEAYEGLCRAARKFNPEKSGRFFIYAPYWCRAMIVRYIINNWRLVKVGTTQAQRKLFFAMTDILDRNNADGEPLTTDQLSQMLGVPEGQIVEMQKRLSLPDLRLDAPVGEEGDSTIGDFFPAPVDVAEDAELSEFRGRVRDLLSDFIAETPLTERERTLIFERLSSDDPITLQAIGNREPVSRERVRQTESKLVRKLKKFLMDRDPDLCNLFISEEKS